MDCFRALQRHYTTLIYITVICTVAAALVSLMQARMYQSIASVEIQGINDNFLNTGDVFPATALSGSDWNANVQTQAEILQQDALIERVVRKLRLDERPEYQSGTNAQAVFASPLAVRNAILALKKNLSIVPLRGSRIVQIVCEARQPGLAADIANALAEALIETNIESRQRAAEQTYAALNVQLAVVSHRLVDSENRLADVGRSTAGSSLALRLTSLEELKREVELNRKAFETMSQRLDDARVASSVRQANIRLVSPAQAAEDAYKPNLPFNLALGAISGLILGVGFIMLREQSRPTVRLPGEAAISLALQELGVIPRVKRTSSLGLVFNHSGREKDPAGRIAWGELSQMSESFRATLASLLPPNRRADHPRVLIVTSSWPMEGKTTIVSNLAVSLTEIGKKVLVIDGDMRRPRLHKVFDRANSWGLSDILREQNAIEDLPLDVLVTKTAIPGLSLLPSGASAANITGLLWSGRMARLLPRFREVFDHVLVDAPPCLEFADARIMARYADQLVLVVRANYTDRRAAQAAVRRLSLDEIPVRGVILNCCDPGRTGLYDYADYGAMQ